MFKRVGVCVAAAFVATVAATASEPSTPQPKTGAAFGVAVLSGDKAWVNARIYGPTAIALDSKHFAFQLRSEKTGEVYFVGATAGEQRRIAAPDARWKALSQAFAIRLPRVADGVYDLEVKIAVVSRRVESVTSVAEPLYVDQTNVVPVRTGTRFYRGPDWYHPSMPPEFVLNRIELDSNGLLTKYDYSPGPEDIHLDPGDEYPNGDMPAEIDDPFINRLNEEYSRKPLWTFGKFEYRCYGAPHMGRDVDADERIPMFIDHFIRVAGSPTQRQIVDQWEPCSPCGSNAILATDDPVVAMFSPLQTDIQWLRSGVIPRESPYAGMCTRGTYAFVDDSDIERTFTTEDPHTVHPEWDPKLRAAMLDFKMQVGMSHEMVAFAMGYPSMRGTREDLDRLSTWTWHLGTSCQARATFDGDRLVKFEGAPCVQTVFVIG